MAPEPLSNEELTELLEQTFSSVDEVASGLAGGEWDLPTDCPGWTVKDILAHLASYEAIAAGLARPATADIAHCSHVKAGDAFGEPNEREIEARRALPPGRILEEFRAATMERIKHLRSLDDAGWASDVSVFPWGEVPSNAMLPIRILDAFFHEQDIRRATQRPGHLNGAVAQLVFERLALALPRVVAKTAGAPDGSVVVFAVGPPGRTVAIETRAGKGEPIESPTSATTTIRCDIEPFLCLMGGRWTPERARAAGVSVDGDRELGEKILGAMTVVP